MPNSAIAPAVIAEVLVAFGTVTDVAPEVGALALHAPAVGPFGATMAGRSVLQAVAPRALHGKVP